MIATFFTPAQGSPAHHPTSSKHKAEACYGCTTCPPLPAGLTELFASGELVLRGEAKPCLPARLEVTGETTARLFLKEGKYHQVRRMFASQGCPVTDLHRSGVGELLLGDLPSGKWQPVAPAEIS